MSELWISKKLSTSSWPKKQILPSSDVSEEGGVTMYWLFYVRDHTWSVIFVYALVQD